MPDNETNKMQELLSEFQEICNANLRRYFAVLQLNNEHPNLFSDEMKNMLVEYGMLQFFGQWERFIEQCFIEFMLGEKSIVGCLPNRYVLPTNADHAYEIVKNVNSYPEWTNIDKLTTNAKNFFENGGPFQPLTTMSAKLNEIKKIRNAIAHTSKKTKIDFDNIVRSKIGHSLNGITPAKFLSEQKIGRKPTDPTYYEYYINYIKETAEMLCSFSTEDDHLL